MINVAIQAITKTSLGDYVNEDHVNILADGYYSVSHPISFSFFIFYPTCSILISSRPCFGKMQQKQNAIAWKHYPYYLPFVRGIICNGSITLTTGQQCGVLIFAFLLVWTNCWANNWVADILGVALKSCYTCLYCSAVMCWNKSSRVPPSNRERRTECWRRVSTNNHSLYVCAYGFMFQNTLHLIEVETKWPTSCWRHFQIHVLKRLYFHSNSTKLEPEVQLTNLPISGLDKITAILQATFSNAFSWMKNFDFSLNFHWGLFLRTQLMITQHWFSI